MKKRKVTRPVDVSKLPARHRAAIAMLSKWAKEKSSVEFIDHLSRLRFPGGLIDTSDEEFIGFKLLGSAGILTETFQFAWKKITVSSSGWEIVNIEEDDGRRFSIRKDRSRQSPDKDIELVMEKLSYWQKAKTNVYVNISLASTCSFAFLGRVDQVFIDSAAGGAIIKSDNSGGAFLLLLNGCICDKSNTDDKVSILEVISQLRVRISEKQFTPEQLLEQLPLTTSFVQ